MDKEEFDAMWVEKREQVTVERLAQMSGLSEDEVCRLVDYGALAPTNPDEAQWTFAQG